MLNVSFDNSIRIHIYRLTTENFFLKSLIFYLSNDSFLFQGLVFKGENAFTCIKQQYFKGLIANMKILISILSSKKGFLKSLIFYFLVMSFYMKGWR